MTFKYSNSFNLTKISLVFQMLMGIVIVSNCANKEGFVVKDSNASAQMKEFLVYLDHVKVLIVLYFLETLVFIKNFNHSCIEFIND